MRSIVVLDDDAGEIITLFLWCWAQSDLLCLNVRSSAKCERVIDRYLRKLAGEGSVLQNREAARMVLNSEEVDVNATAESH